MQPMNSKQLAITVSGLEKSFGRGADVIHVLKRIELQAYYGEIMMLVGPSGCGKTTLLSAIAGTMKPDRGTLNVLGKELEKTSGGELTRFRAKHIGFIFQQFNLIPTINLAENVAVPLLIQKVPYAKAIERARAMLDQVQLGERWKSRPNQLSGGQQQRVAIARALVHEPPLVICDEPTAALDAKNGEIVLDLFREIARSPERAVIIVTHDNRIFSYADRIATMDDGEILSVERQDQSSAPKFIHH